MRAFLVGLILTVGANAFAAYEGRWEGQGKSRCSLEEELYRLDLVKDQEAYQLIVTWPKLSNTSYVRYEGPREFFDGFGTDDQIFDILFRSTGNSIKLNEDGTLDVVLDIDGHPLLIFWT